MMPDGSSHAPEPAHGRASADDGTVPSDPPSPPAHSRRATVPGDDHAGVHGHGHSHGHGGPWWNFAWNRAGRRLGVAVSVTLVLTLAGALALWPSGDREPPALANADIDRRTVTVLDVEPAPCIGNPDGPVPCQDVVFDLGGEATGSFQQTPAVTTPVIEPGDRIVVADQGLEVDQRFRYYFLDFARSTWLIALFVLFAGAVVLLGRLQGLRSIVALALSFAVLAFFTLPALLESAAPVLVAIIGSAAVATITLFFTHGVNHLSAVSLLGSLGSLGITGALAWVFVEVTHLTGLSDEDALFLVTGDASVDLQGLLLAGIIIGTVGVLDDVTVTQAAAVAEIHAADPSMPSGRLYRSALRVGRDHIGSTTNTLVFAYAGAALPLLLLFTQVQLDLSVVLTSEIVAIEIVRALVGGIGLVASVPITTALATWTVRGESGPAAGG